MNVAVVASYRYKWRRLGRYVGKDAIIVGPNDRKGNLIMEWSDPALLDGPWDLTLHEENGAAKIFVSNVLSGTVTRLDLGVSTNSVWIR